MIFEQGVCVVSKGMIMECVFDTYLNFILLNDFNALNSPKRTHFLEKLILAFYLPDNFDRVISERF